MSLLANRFQIMPSFGAVGTVGVAIWIFGCAEASSQGDMDIQTAAAEDPMCDAAQLTTQCQLNHKNQKQCTDGLYISLDAYCETSDCPLDTAAFEAEFTTCETSPEDRHGNCPLRRYIGCGEWLYFADYEESGIAAHNYDAETRQLQGMFYSSDTPMFCNRSHIIQIGESYLPPTGQNACPEYVETFCCFDE